MGNELYDDIKRHNQELFDQIEEIKKNFYLCFGMPLDLSFLMTERKPKKKIKSKEFLRNEIPMLHDMVSDLSGLQGRLRDCGKSDDETMNKYIHDRIIGTCEIGLDVLTEILEELKCEDE